MKRSIWLCVLLVSAAGLFADTFAFKFTKGEKYRIVATVKGRVFVNGEFASDMNYLNKIAVEVVDVRNGAGSISALYQVSARDGGEGGGDGYLLNEEARSAFTIDAQGRYTVGPSSLYPLTRNVPLFPRADMSPEFTWSAPGIEVRDLREPFGIRSPFSFPVTVHYTFLGVKDDGGERIAQFEIRYAYETKVAGVEPRKGAPKLVLISGENRMRYDWNVAEGREESYAEEFIALYTLADGATIEFRGAAQGEVIVAQPLDRDKAAEDINREIEKNRLEGVRAEKADQGVKITLEDILFQPDSDAITPGEAGKIGIIAGILKAYPDRDVKVVGHTAAVGTPESCMELSILRAKAVGNALLTLEARRPDQMTIQGKGLTEPIAPNSTAAGRARNRRVEITILEN